MGVGGEKVRMKNRGGRREGIYIRNKVWRESERNVEEGAREREGSNRKRRGVAREGETGVCHQQGGEIDIGR